jgi:hypothetical protein
MVGPPRSGVAVVDGDTVPWINGRAVLASMAPAFRDNLGDPGRVDELLGKYWLRPLWVDETTSRRIDHVRTDPGYADLSEAYHDSVEESLFLGGSVDLTAEGHLQAGDYFWRPPGWVHSASSRDGFECILMMEGDDVAEGSGPASRVVCGDDEAGQFQLPAARRGEPDASIGPRGYVRRLETRFLPLEDHDDDSTRLVDDAALPVRSRVLSRNHHTRSVSTLVALPAGWRAEPPASDRERFLVLIDGAIEVDGHVLAPCSLVRIAVGSSGPLVVSDRGARLLVKAGAPQ